MGIEFFTGSEGGVSNNLVYKALIHRLFKSTHMVRESTCDSSKNCEVA